jgi:5-(aminomethyl)-3-furanmethanol phosphate kinase
MKRPRSPRRVIKIGGSLFDLPNWAGDVDFWIDRQSPATTLIVVGGGSTADEVFANQRASGISNAEAHWRCIRLMGETSRRLAALTGRYLVSKPRDLDFTVDAATLVIEADVFMEKVDAALGPRALPESWDVSSDSIAARAAELFAADELVLLKSTLPADVRDLRDYVDRYFAEASRKLPAVRFVNLRDSAFPEVRLR